ncbi:MAG: histidine kinase [Cyanobacteriota bacterium]
MLNSNTKQTLQSKKDSHSSTFLQLLLFVDERPSSQDNIQHIRSYLDNLRDDYSFELQIVEVGNNPDLAEHFRLVATPALVKICPEPRHILAGSDLVGQLKKWWSRWQQGVESDQIELSQLEDSDVPRGDRHRQADSSSFPQASIGYSAEVIRLSDEVFRLKREKEELLGQLQFKDQILAMLAHDLRSPLTAASIALETIELAETKCDPERAAKLREQLCKQARVQFRIMNRMISDILQAAKANNAQLQIQPQKLRVQLLFQDILSHFQDRFQEKSLQLETDLPQDVPAVYGDEELIRQVIVNLLENAIKYTPEGGKIGVSLLHRTTQKVQVTICDNGPGIPEEKCDRIFEGHFRLKRDEQKEGYGLGLSLCRKVVQAHYGHIWVDSEIDQGSCFHFTLPVCQF